MNAPDFTPGYPSKGGRIGPAWSCAWTLLDDGEWRTSREIVELMIGLPEPLLPKTAGALLRQACAAGHLERRQTPNRGERVWYRRIKEGES